MEVGDSEHGERLDRVLAARGIASRSEAKRWIDAGRVHVAGVVASPKTRVREGAWITIDPPAPLSSAAEPEDLPLDIRFEDDHLLVVHKDAGQVVHPAPGHPGGTLVNALLHHVKFQDVTGDPTRPGIVHRLDKDTSGVLVVAKTSGAREGLVALFQNHTIERRYDAIAVGPIPERITLDTWHGRHPKDRKRFTSRTDRGKRAVTHVERRERLHVASHIWCRLETGRTHQIRVHLGDYGAPILADPVYGGRTRDPRLREAAAAVGRQALHAGVLGFVHPITGENVRVEVDPPADFLSALALLRR